MNELKKYRANDVCEALNISNHTLRHWYLLERKQIVAGLIKDNYLPQPLIDSTMRGKPRIWTCEMVNELRHYKENIVLGRNGIYGAYSNPNHFSTNKYKKSVEVVDNN